MQKSGELPFDEYERRKPVNVTREKKYEMYFRTFYALIISKIHQNYIMWSSWKN